MTTLVEEVKPVVRYVIRLDGKYLYTAVAHHDMSFAGPDPNDALKFATVEDAEQVIKEIFDYPVPLVFDPKSATNIPDVAKSYHIGMHHGQDKSKLEIVATHF